MPMKYAFLFLIPLLLYGCSDNKNKVQERIHYWKENLEASVHIGDSREVFINWANKNDLNIIYDEINHKYVSIIETIPVNNLVCSKWHIMLNISFDSKNNVKQRKIESAGVCL